MALTVHLWLKANKNDIKGESTQKSLGRENSIECLSFSYGVAAAVDSMNNMVAGQRMHQPISILKRVDAASPLIVKALCNNEKIDGTFKFYRPNPAGDGTTEQFYTVEIKEGNVRAVSQEASFGSDAPTERVEFVFKDIVWRYEKGGISHKDSWGGDSK